MQKFYFHEKEKLDGLNRMVIGVLEKYNRQDYDTGKALGQLLDESVKLYHDQGYPSRENNSVSLKAEWETALRGIHPLTLEKQVTGRQGMQTAIIYRCLQELAGMLRADLQQMDDRLAGARTLVEQVIVAAWQAGLLDAAKLKKIKTQKDLENMWDGLAADAQIALGQKRLLLSVSRYDILLLCEEAIDRLS